MSLGLFRFKSSPRGGSATPIRPVVARIFQMFKVGVAARGQIVAFMCAFHFHPFPLNPSGSTQVPQVFLKLSSDSSNQHFKLHSDSTSCQLMGFQLVVHVRVSEYAGDVGGVEIPSLNGKCYCSVPKEPRYL